MFLSVVIFGSNRNNGIFVQLSETSSALSVDAVQSTSCLARSSIVDETVKDRYKIADPVGVGLGSAQSSRLSRIQS